MNYDNERKGILEITPRGEVMNYDNSYKVDLYDFEIMKLESTISYLSQELEKYKDKKEKEYEEVAVALKERIKDCRDQLTVLFLNKSLKLQSKTA